MPRSVVRALGVEFEAVEQVGLQVAGEALQQPNYVPAFLDEAAAALAHLLFAQVRADHAQGGASGLERLPPTPRKSIKVRRPPRATQLLRDQLALHETCGALDYAAHALPLRAALAAENGW
ncbi:MAG TPA: hypothetical protein VF895_01495 [Gaiellaceae bacterium]